jgi:hypothetical protein
MYLSYRISTTLEETVSPSRKASCFSVILDLFFSSAFANRSSGVVVCSAFLCFFFAKSNLGE